MKDIERTNDLEYKEYQNKWIHEVNCMKWVKLEVFNWKFFMDELVDQFWCMEISLVSEY